MGVFKKVTAEIREVAMLTVFIVIISLVLLGFKANSLMTSALNTTVDTVLTAIASPITWVSLVVIAIIGFALLKYFGNKKNMN